MGDFAAGFSQIFSCIQTASGDQPVYLVGGAVRDAMLNRAVHDLDVVLASGAKKAARKTADMLGGAFYMLDEARDTARVITKNDTGETLVIDFAVFRGDNLEDDLRGRDFTINAMALNLAQLDTIIDPLRGAAHLRERLLVVCKPASLKDDPARILRALRLSLDLGLRLPPETSQLLREARAGLSSVSAERLRDELFRMLDTPQAGAALRLIDHFGLLAYLLPELEALKGVRQSSPHTLDVWEHTLAVLDALSGLFAALVEGYNADKVANVHLSTAVLMLGKYRPSFQAHFQEKLNPQRTLRALLALAALYHDAGKPQHFKEEISGRVRFLGHEDTSAVLARQRGAALALSLAETQHLWVVAAEHMRIHHLAMKGAEPTRRAVYRYFRATGKAGVDIILLSLADTLGTYGVTLMQEHWEDELRVCRRLLEGYWELPQELVSPPRLLTGNELIALFDLKPGREIGILLDAVQEAQACGEIQTREEAVNFIKVMLKEYYSDKERNDHDEPFRRA